MACTSGTDTVSVIVAVTVTATSPVPPPRQNKSCYAQLVYQTNRDHASTLKVTN